VQNLSITSTKAGDIFAGGAVTALMAEADNLQRFTVSSATASNMILGGVGTDALFNGASDLEFVSISAGIASTSSSGVSMPTTPSVSVVPVRPRCPPFW
jgi:hypothetical protein